MGVQTPEPLNHLTPERTSAGGLWLDDEFLWDFLPRLSPLAAYVYLALGRYTTQARYPSADDLAEECKRSKAFIVRAIQELRRHDLLNDHDLVRLMNLKTEEGIE